VNGFKKRQGRVGEFPINRCRTICGTITLSGRATATVVGRRLVYEQLAVFLIVGTNASREIATELCEEDKKGLWKRTKDRRDFKLGLLA